MRIGMGPFKTKGSILSLKLLYSSLPLRNFWNENEKKCWRVLRLERIAHMTTFPSLTLSAFTSSGSFSCSAMLFQSLTQ